MKYILVICIMSQIGGSGMRQYAFSPRFSRYKRGCSWRGMGGRGVRATEIEGAMQFLLRPRQALPQRRRSMGIGPQPHRVKAVTVVSIRVPARGATGGQVTRLCDYDDTGQPPLNSH
jgi:hypothetical protein